MRKAFFIAYVVLSLLVFFTGIKSLFSGHGGKLGKAGDIVYCSKFFPNTCTQGGCTAGDNARADNCTIYGCRGRCLVYNKTMECEKWEEESTTCTRAGGDSGSGNDNNNNNCDPAVLYTYGECVPRI